MSSFTHFLTRPQEAKRQIEKARQQAWQFAQQWIFERVFRNIFRSQIDLLRHLQQSDPQQAPLSALLRFYEGGITGKGIPNTSYPYENYIGFLRNFGLIELAPASGTTERVVSLTPLGSNFLQYIERFNYNPFEKPF